MFKEGQKEKEKKEPREAEDCSVPLVHRNLNLISRKKEKIERFKVQGMRMRH